MRIAIVLGVLCLGVLSGQAFAMCGGGGMRIVGAGHSGGHKKANAAAEAKKWDLPPAAAVPTLDASKFESALSSLNLTGDQMIKVSALKTQIANQIQELAKTQDDARSAYAKITPQGSWMAAAQAVGNAAEACRRFDATRKFELGLAGILTAEQWSRYRELTQRS